MLNQQQKDLSLLSGELMEINSKLKMSPADVQRSKNLASMISAVKAGASLSELDQDDLNTRERAAGLRLTSLTTRKFLNQEQESEARGWMKAIEQRNQTELEGNLLNGIGTYSSLGYFVPTGFFQRLFLAMKAHDFLYDEDSVTLLKTTSGLPMQVPVAGDTEQVAAVTSEAGPRSAINIQAPSGVSLASYSYASPYQFMSIECFQDLDASFGAAKIFERIEADRLARGIGKDLLLGDGSGTTLGIIPSLTTAGVSPTIAVGASANTGGSQTGANSLGSQDFANLISNIDQAYLASDKCAFVMNLATLAYIETLIDKYGNLLRLVQRDADGMPRIFGIPVKTSPSMPGIGASNISVLLGDFSYWVTRLVQNDASGVQVFQEAPGLVEAGVVGLRTFMRAHGVLAYNDANSPSPIQYLQHHS